jgi:2-polyprenyl-6-methoxyphenol hydroxylase-like FAD-dependent oxidoreductase
MTVIVAGAGIGGLTLALSLHQAGIPVQLIEQSERLAPLGVGINLLPHAVRELDELGLRNRLVVSGIETAELSYYSPRGQRIWSEPRGLEAGYRWPQVSIHRGVLQMLLYDSVCERLGTDAVSLGTRVAGVVQTDDGVEAALTDRRGMPAGSVTGAVLIAADGILWRGVSEGPPFLTGRSMIMAGHERQKFVCYPISNAAATPGQQVINWIAEKKFDADHDWPREDWNRPGDPADFLPDFEGWRFDWLDVPGLIRGARAIFEFPMVDRDPLPRWSHGRVTLLGDAAHPMYPIGSNGASQAILDARVLTAELMAHGPGEAALYAYDAARRPATAAIVAANRQNGPEQVMQLVQTRAPDGFDDIDAVVSPAEREATAQGYKRIAGFEVEALNARPSIVQLPAGAH